MNFSEIITCEHIEVSTKYLFLALNTLFTENNREQIKIDDISMFLGISKAQIYRARKQLIRFCLLEVVKKFNIETGKLAHESYLFNKDPQDYLTEHFNNLFPKETKILSFDEWLTRFCN